MNVEEALKAGRPNGSSRPLCLAGTLNRTRFCLPFHPASSPTRCNLFDGCAGACFHYAIPADMDDDDLVLIVFKEMNDFVEKAVECQSREAAVSVVLGIT